jgi:hypothetical protein
MMLGRSPIGAIALGQISTGSPLQAATGAFALTGIAAPLQTRLANQVYAIDSTNSAFSAGTFNKNLLRSGLTPAPLSATIAASASQSIWAISGAGDTSLGAVTNYTTQLNVTSGDANIFGSVQFIRTDSVGSFITQSAVTPEQSLTTGTFTFSLAGVNLGTFGSTDRLLVVVFLRNNDGAASHNVTIGLGTLTSSIVSIGGAYYALTGYSTTPVLQLVATRAIYTLTGNAATFAQTFVVAQASYALTGIATTMQTQLVAAKGAYTLTGYGAGGVFPMSVTTGTYLLTGFSVAFDPAEVVQTGVFILNGNDAYLSYAYNLGGTNLQPTGPTFTRKRWLEMIAEAEAKARGEREAEAFRREAALDAARKAIEKAQAQVRAARAAQQAEWDEQARIRAHVATLASDQGLANLHDRMQLASDLAAMSRHAHAQQLANDQDDDEALALLLSH